MSVDSNILLNLNVSPRLVLVLPSGLEVAVQDLHDTVQRLMDAPQNKTYPIMLDSGGKEVLGGGVLVGITTTLKDSKLAFIGHTTSIEQGTITTANSVGDRVIDSTAQFVTKNVEVGATVINLRDFSVATVVRIVSETELETLVLDDGTTDDWLVGDNYKVWNIVQVELSGGNVVSLDQNGQPQSPVLPTAFTQVVRTSSSSATLVELKAIQHSSFNNGVTIDVVNGVSGTLFPFGTPEKPVSSLADAKIIAAARGFTVLYIVGNFTLSATDDVDGFEIVGESPAKTQVNVIVGCSTLDTEFRNLTVTGTLSGKVSVQDCHLKRTFGLAGDVRLTLFQDDVDLDNSDPTVIVDCWDGIAGIAFPVLNLGGVTPGLVINNWSGSLAIANQTGGNCAIEFVSGYLTLLSSCTGGTLTVGGVIPQPINSSTGMTLDFKGIVNPEVILDGVGDKVWNSLLSDHQQIGSYGLIVTLMKKVMANKLITDPITGILTIFEDDDITPFLQTNIFEDEAGLQAYRGQGMDRRNRLS